MTHELDNKAVTVEKERGAAVADAQTNSNINSIDFLKSAPANSCDDWKSKLKDSDDKHLGKLEIGDLKPNKLDGDWGKKEFAEKMEPLSHTETMILKNMKGALDSGNIDQIEDALKTLQENPRSVDRILSALKSQMENENFLSHVGWEQGRDNAGNEFVRLNLYHADSSSKSSGGTNLIIGSDGFSAATHNERFDAPNKPIEANNAIQAFLPEKPDLQVWPADDYKKAFSK